MTAETDRHPLLRWTTLAPAAAALLLVATWGRKNLLDVVVVLVALVLIAAVLAAVHHAEVIAHRVGEPFGSLVLAVAVTVIEVALIVTLMAAGGEGSSTLARDTVFSAVIITCTGVIGISLVVATLRDRVALFNAEGARPALAAITTLTVLCLVLPTFTTSVAEPEFSGEQLTFAAVAAVAVYALFVLTQTVRHRDYFLPVDEAGTSSTRRPQAPTGQMSTERTRRRRRRGSRSRASVCCSSRWSAWSVWRRSSRRRSRRGSPPPVSRTLSSA